jgi:coenzyme F420 biosynthesis associated uncharacterized protein
MAGYGAAFGRGVIIGAGAAFLYAAARETASFARHARRESQAGSEYAERTRLIDWGWAERVAIRASGQAPTLHPSAREQLRAQYSALLREIEEPIARYTGKTLSLSSTAVEIMDRATWIRANMVNFRDLLQPMEELYREAAEAGGLGLGSSPVGMPVAARFMVSSQLGLLVGYLAQRVLGQYDLSLLGREPITGGKLYFVEPNIRQVEQSLRLPREELRRWIALHEATHAHEFEFHPWVREYLNTALRTYLRLLADDMKRQSGGNVFAVMAARFAGNVWRGHNFIAALQTPEQRELLSRLQALMSLAEGYSNHVMNAVGRSLLPNFELIHERVEHRQRQRSQAEVLFLKLTGLSMKMEQYKRGERFVDHVVRERGIAFANRAWESRENLPSELEIRYPERWIARLEGMRA